MSEDHAWIVKGAKSAAMPVKRICMSGTGLDGLECPQLIHVGPHHAEGLVNPKVGYY
jgi:hypothetical protein